MTDHPDSTTAHDGRYLGLARRYRPGHFRDLIGQEAMVRTLTASFEQGRIAQAFILTGVRGVGKTTTARILAKGLNCERGDGPTIDPCGECPACQRIAAGTHVEVIEMDAASNTGVDYIREINDAVRYRPAEARYKVYIIDEVHMLTTSSFNALLKTLEEPPEHVVFILATTEIRKVPVTVLSRCQRFDLRRIEPEAMIAYLAMVSEKEGATIEDGALALIARAAEGSMRDALSILDQALTPGTETTAEQVRAMLGLADRGRIIDLFEAIMRGDAKAALDDLSRQYADGADPAVVLKDLADLTHWLSVIRISESAADDPTVGPDERARGRDLAGRLSMRVLTRTWQMLLKALEEVAIAPNAMMAAEMALIRLTHVADLPPPEELVRRLTEESTRPAPSTTPPPNGGGARLSAIGGGRVAAPEPVPESPLAAYPSFADVTALLSENREIRLLEAIETHVSLVAYRPGVIEFHPVENAPADLAARLADTLRRLTDARWSVALTDTPGEPTLAATKHARETEARTRAEDHPMVKAALAVFPDAEVRTVRRPADTPAILPTMLERIDVDEMIDDDPFEED
ncbi:MAG: DNA polymerase III subunit gamma/tau [Pseudomonadota bacterium]